MSAVERDRRGRGRGAAPAADDAAADLSVLLSPDALDRLEVSAAPAAPATPETAQAAIERKIFELAACGQGVGSACSPLVPVPATTTWHQTFDLAWVLWHPDTGAFALRRDSAIARRYESAGGAAGYLGAPVSDEDTVGAGTVCRFAFDGGAITSHPRLGTHETRGAIGQHWLDRLGGPAGRWGFPASPEYDAGGGVRAQDFEGGTLAWRDGIVERPLHREHEVSAWLTLLEEPRRGATAGPLIRPHGAGALRTCRQIEARRALLPPVAEARSGRRHLTTTVDATALADSDFPPGVTAQHLLQARVDLWHDLWHDVTGPAALRPSAPNQLVWAGFAADGELQALIRTLLQRSPEARTLLLAVGISVEELGRRPVFVAADTEHGRRLYADDAERYICRDTRLRTLFDHIAQGSLPRRLLTAAGVAADGGGALRQAMLDAQFITATSALPAWALLPRWTRRLRAAVAHNIRAGCITGWRAFEGTGGDPVEVVRALAWDFFCGPAALGAQSRARFEGALGHGALARTAATFPIVAHDDDGAARYIVAGNARRRVPPRG